MDLVGLPTRDEDDLMMTPRGDDESTDDEADVWLGWAGASAPSRD
jgi:hypothetical protein